MDPPQTPLRGVRTPLRGGTTLPKGVVTPLRGVINPTYTPPKGFELLNITAAGAVDRELLYIE